MTKYDQLNIMLENIKNEEYQRRNNFANICFQKLIIPICKEHKINFQCSMGTWSFENKKGDIIENANVIII